MQLFYAPQITLPLYTLTEEESRHCVKVLRLSKGDSLYLTDGFGRLFTAVVEMPDIRKCHVRITETAESFEARPYNLTVACAPTKNSDRFEWFAEKATEVGIDRIVPLLCRHSERRTLNTERVERVVVSAMKQSLKAYKPAVELVTGFEEFIHEDAAEYKFIAHCREDCGERVYLGDYIRPSSSITVLIGPEGDFSREEIDAALKIGYVGVHLGSMRLRTETAALMAAMCVSFINYRGVGESGIAASASGNAQ